MTTSEQVLRATSCPKGFYHSGELATSDNSKSLLSFETLNFVRAMFSKLFDIYRNSGYIGFLVGISMVSTFSANFYFNLRSKFDSLVGKRVEQVVWQIYRLFG